MGGTSQPLNALLRALAHADVDALVLTSDEVAQIERGDKRAALTQKPITQEQLQILLEPTQLFAVLAGSTAAQVQHLFAQEGGRYLATAWRGANGLRIRIERAPAEAVVRAQAAEPAAAATASDVAAAAMPALRSRSTVNVPAPTQKAATSPPEGMAAGVADAPRTAAVQPSEPCLRALVAARAQGASDVHFASNAPPRVRRAGALAAQGEAIGDGALAAFVQRVMPPALQPRLEHEGYADFACDLPGAGRLRANVCRHTGGLKLCLRLVAGAVRSLAELGLPQELAAAGQYHQGLVVVAGPQGHGKSSTLAALLDMFNRGRRSHIISVEDPIEILHPRHQALLSQREVGSHTRSFARALKASLREDPDIIAIGELRDRETIEMALAAAETGHLVLTTMNTRSAAKTIDRLIDLFPPGEQPQVRAALAGALKMIVSQRLVPALDGTQVPAVEIVTGSPPLWALIRDNKLVQLPTLQQRGASLGMLLLDQSLAQLVGQKKIALEQALALAEQPHELQRRVQAMAAGGTSS